MLIVVFGLAAATSLVMSTILVSRIERVGERLGASEALLGLLAALAADAPEITSAVAAFAGGEAAVGLGVALGSNVFNLAALLGLGAVVAGRIRLHRRVVELEGSLALFIAITCLVVLVGGAGPALGLGVILVVFVPYVGVSALRPAARAHLPIPRPLQRWLSGALREEEAELSEAIRPRPGTVLDAVVTLGAAVVVVGAGLAMEQTATTLGAQAGIPDIIVGGLVLAAVTSLPNAVAAVHLASHGRGQATLSEALNSNAINVLVGLLIPATLVGLSAFSGGELLIVWAYLGLTALTVALAWSGRGLSRRSGFAIIAGYLLFAAVLAIR